MGAGELGRGDFEFGKEGEQLFFDAGDRRGGEDKEMVGFELRLEVEGLFFVVGVEGFLHQEEEGF